MMQQLYFHPAWDKTISPQDRASIENLFEQTYRRIDDLIMSPAIRTAINYKNELLVTVLVHNFTHHSATFNNRTVYVHYGSFHAEQAFTIPELVIAPFTSMPWTFIFKERTEYEKLTLEKVVLEIE